MAWSGFRVFMRSLFLKDETETVRLGRFIAPNLVPGNTIGLIGGLGAGKSHLARSIIQTNLERVGQTSDIPSPSYSLIQTYWIGAVEYCHADLYRLGDISEISELGLEEAFATCVCLVEWADLLGNTAPDNLLQVRLEFDPGSGGREVTFEAFGTGWDWLDDVLCAMKENTNEPRH